MDCCAAACCATFACAAAPPTFEAESLNDPPDEGAVMEFDDDTVDRLAAEIAVTSEGGTGCPPPLALGLDGSTTAWLLAEGRVRAFWMAIPKRDRPLCAAAFVRRIGLDGTDEGAVAPLQTSAHEFHSSEFCAYFCEQASGHWDWKSAPTIGLNACASFAKTPPCCVD